MPQQLQQQQQSAPFRMLPARPPETAQVDIAHDDEDVALGCECADPRLQIDAWSDEFTASAFNA